jgi:hypothetical protein
MIKWKMNDVTFNRGNYRPLIAHFDNSKCWLALAAMTTTTGFRSEIRQLASEYGAKIIELKYMYDEEDRQTETEVIDFLKLDTGYIFRNELKVPAGTRRQFIKYSPDEIFQIN